MTEEEFVSLCCDILPSVGSFHRFGKIVFNTFDTDKSGEVDFTELMTGLHITADGSYEEKCEWAFRMYDEDGDGEIEFKEMKRLVVLNIILFKPIYGMIFLSVH